MGRKFVQRFAPVLLAVSIIGGVFSLLATGKSFANADSASKTAVIPPSVHAGDSAPDFTLLNQERQPVALGDYTGKWVVLYFYPRDFSQGCTLEAHNFQRDLQKYAERNAVILGVSVDSVRSHQDFCSKEGLNFKLLADTNAAISARYGSLHEWYGHQVSARNTFLINPYGIVAHVFTGVQPGTHSNEVLTELVRLQKQN